MKTKILEQLKTKYKTLGFGEKAFDGVAEYLSKLITRDEEVDGIITGAEPLLKAFQGDIDKRVTDAIEKAKEKWEKDTPAKKKPDEPAKTEPKVPDDAPEWAKTLMQTNTSLLEEVASLRRTNTMQGQHSKIKSKLEESKVPEIYFGKLLSGRTFKDDAEIDQFTSDIVTGWGEVRQKLADENLGQSHKPLLGDKQKDGVSSAVKDFIEAKTKPATTDSLGGKQLIPSN